MRKPNILKPYLSLTNLAVLIILIVSVSFVIANLQPAHWLVSNNLAYPELVPPAANQNQFAAVVSREISAGNYYRLPAEIVSVALNILLPASAVRYVYFGLLLIAGALGMFWLCRTWLEQRRNAHRIEAGALAAGLLYAGSTVMLQALFSADVAVVTAFAVLPWLLLATYKFMTSRSHRWLGVLAVASILSLEIGIDPILALFVLLLVWVLALRKHRSQREWWVIAITLVINLAWLLPVLYRLATGGVLAVPADATVTEHLPVLLQLFNSGSFGTSRLLADFHTDWIAYWQSPVVMPLLIIPLILAIIAGIWQLFAGKGIGRLIGLVAIVGIGGLIAVNLGISIGFVTLPAIAVVKQILAVTGGLAMALVLGRSVNWLLARQLPKLTGSHLSAVIVTASATLLYIVLICLPVYQNHLYPASQQPALPESFAQLYDYFRSNGTNGNILYISENQQQDPVSFEYTTTGDPLSDYALSQPVITLANPETRQIYVNLVHDLSTGNATQLQNAWERYNIDWVVVDQSVMQPDVKADSVQIAPLLTTQPSLQRIDYIDAGHNELEFFKVSGRKLQSPVALHTPAIQSSQPAFAGYAIASGGQPEAGVSQGGQVTYPLRNLEATSISFDTSAGVAGFHTALPGNSYTSMVLPAMDDLNLEDVKLQLKPASGKLQISLQNAYPQVIINGKIADSDLTEVPLLTTDMPSASYMIAMNDQTWGPFAPNTSATVDIDKLELEADQNLRIYEQYDDNNVTGQFEQSLARNCVTYDLIPGANTTADNHGVHISSPEDICIAADLPLIETDASVLTRTDIDYSTNVQMAVCMFSKVTSDCINHDLPVGINDSQTHSLEIVEELGKVGLHDLQTKFFFTRNGNQSTRTANINNINITEYKLVTSETLSIPAWNAIQTIAVSSPQDVAFNIPMHSVATSDFDSGAFIDSFKPCTDSATKVNLITQQSTHALNVSTSGSLCLTKAYPGQRLNRGHFLQMNYTLPAAQQVQMCVWDEQHDICLQTATLSGNAQPQTFTLPIPRRGSSDSDYKVVFHEDNLAGNFVISNMTLAEANTDTLSEIYFSQGLPQTYSTANLDFKPNSIGKLLSVGAADDTDAPQTLTLSQAFAPQTWRLAPGTHNGDFMNLMFSTNNDTPAVEVNGWQQGWQVSSGDYTIVNTNAVITQFLLAVQAIGLFLLLILPSAKEILISGMLRKTKK